jgi:superfamily II DNA or RNA helicase
LPGYFCWDPRVQRYRAPAQILPRFREWLGQGGIEVVFRSPRPDGFQPLPVRRDALPSLRPYQQDALQSWVAAGSRGLVALPTGSGKTRLAIRALLDLGRPALIAVPTRHLLHQWKAALAQFYSGPIGLLGDGEQTIEPFTIATYESARIHMDRIGDHFDFLVIDEAHHLASEELQEASGMSTAALRLGLSANFPEDAEWRGRAAAILGPVVYALPISALAGNYLSSFEIKVIALRLSRDEQASYDQARAKFHLHYRPFCETFPQARWIDFVRAAARTPDGREALAALRRSRAITALPRAKVLALDQLLDQHHEEAKLIFTADNRSAYEVSRRFLIPAITCDIERGEREEILGRFRDGVYRAMVSAKVLNEGLDIPAASVAIIAGGSPNPLEHAQRIGRVLRPLPGKKALVYELVVSGTNDWFISERRTRASVLGTASSI